MSDEKEGRKKMEGKRYKKEMKKATSTKRKNKVALVIVEMVVNLSEIGSTGTSYQGMERGW